MKMKREMGVKFLGSHISLHLLTYSNQICRSSPLLLLLLILILLLFVKQEQRETVNLHWEAADDAIVTKKLMPGKAYPPLRR